VIKDFQLADVRNVIIDVTLRHEFHGSRADPQRNGHASHVDVNGALDAAVDLDEVSARGAEDGAAAWQDAADLLDAELHGQAFERALPTIAEADELVAVLLDAAADDAADYCIKAGAVSATGQDTNAHVSLSSIDRLVGM
jgi:hypothetical protein